MTWGPLTNEQLTNLQIGFADNMEGCSHAAIGRLRKRRCNMQALLGWLDGEMARIQSARATPNIGTVQAQQLIGEYRAFNAFRVAIRDGVFHHPEGVA
ncbi:MAG: hypothetical protein Alpg2KO_00150 [Alphaproteobacteria bacterium]